MPYRHHPTYANKRGFCSHPMTQQRVNQKLRDIQEGRTTVEDLQNEFARKVLDENSWCKNMQQINKKKFDEQIEKFVPWHNLSLSPSPISSHQNSIQKTIHRGGGTRRRRRNQQLTRRRRRYSP